MKNYLVLMAVAFAITAAVLSVPDFAAAPMVARGREHRAACEAYCAHAGGELVELQARPDASAATCVCFVSEFETDLE
jgi:putative hemolysin